MLRQKKSQTGFLRHYYICDGNVALIMAAFIELVLHFVSLLALYIT